MLYRKNVGNKERFARLLGGGLMVLCGLVGLHASALGILFAVAGVGTLLTGAIGYCPACAMIGRKPLASE
ncbi:MAG TPA: DUF2892 domain-containing protein [Albitalea sp.]|nr:DUF2892 domain-containing protein [Albitalea sp.]